MRVLKIEDDSNGIIEICRDNFMIDSEHDIPGVSIACKWDSQETFVNIMDVGDLSELIKWLSVIRQEMIAFHSKI